MALRDAEPKDANAVGRPSPANGSVPHGVAVRIAASSWAQLLVRISEELALACPWCAESVPINAPVPDASQVERILDLPPET